MPPTLKVRTLPIGKLIPAPYNPRLALQPTDRRYQKLARSLREFGLVEPLIWNETTGHVVGGHARLAIMKSTGVKRVPVSVVRLTPRREKALNISSSTTWRPRAATIPIASPSCSANWPNCPNSN